MALKQITVSELQPNDVFSFDGQRAYALLQIEHLGAGMYQLRYAHTKQWRKYESIKQGTLKVFVAPVGRHYEG